MKPADFFFNYYTNNTAQTAYFLSTGYFILYNHHRYISKLTI